MLTLDLIGPVRLRRGSAHLPLSVRKTAALLLLAAIAGPLPRVRLVEWLWPALDESTGRRNLRRELARLRELGAGDALVSADDCVAIAPTLALDIDAAAVTPQALLTHWRGPLADGPQRPRRRPHPGGSRAQNLLRRRRLSLEAGGRQNPARRQHSGQYHRQDPVAGNGRRERDGKRSAAE